MADSQTAATSSPASAMQQSSSPNVPGFTFPKDYHFPPFYTRQTNAATRHSQLTKWTDLVLSYARHHRIFRLQVSSAADSELFFNKKLNRRLQSADIRELLDFMHKEGRTEYYYQPAGGAGGGGGGGGGGAGADVVFLHWRTPEEWAALLERYVEDTAQKGSVLTVYELAEGDATRGTELHGMDHEVLLKALNILVKRGKAQIFGQKDSLGVKFF